MVSRARRFASQLRRDAAASTRGCSRACARSRRATAPRASSTPPARSSSAAAARLERRRAVHRHASAEPQALRRLPLPSSGGPAATGRRGRRRPPAGGGRTSLHVGQPRRAATRRGVQDVVISRHPRVSGAAASIGGADDHRPAGSPTCSAGSTEPGELTSIAIAADPGVAPQGSPAAIDSSCRSGLRSAPARGPPTRPRATSTTDRRLPDARAARALPVPRSCRRVHHLQHLLDHGRAADPRVRLLRALGATRRQILLASPWRRSSSARPPRSWDSASVSVRQGIAALFDAVGLGIPTSGLVSRRERSRSRSGRHRRHAAGRRDTGPAGDPRPADRRSAARRSGDPHALPALEAVARGAAWPARPARPRSPACSASGPAASRLATHGDRRGPPVHRRGAGGALVRAPARRRDRPAAGARSSHEPGRLARENAMRNPAAPRRRRRR